VHIQNIGRLIHFPRQCRCSDKHAAHCLDI